MSKSDPPQWWSKPSAVSRYAAAVLSVAIAVIVVRLVVNFLHTEPFVSSFLSAIMFAAWFGGFGPGLLAIALSLVAFHYYLISPIDTFALKFFSLAVDVHELPRLTLFSIAALFVNFLSASQREAAESLRRSRDDLLSAAEIQRRTESALLGSEMYLAEAQRLSQTGSFGWNVSSGELYWSVETFRIFEYDEMAVPTIEMAIQRAHPEDLALVQRTIERASSDGKDFDYEYRLLMPDGSVKHIHVVAHAVRDRIGQLEFIGAVMDVTAAKRAEEDLQEARTELAHAARLTALGELTASIAHEVGQPLSGVVTYGDACLRWLDREVPRLDEARDAVEQMIGGAKRANDVLARIRALSKKGALDRVRLDINQVIDDVIALIRREINVHGVSVRLDLGSSLPPVLGDRVQLQQVVMNLLMNGIQAVSPVTDRPRQLLIRSREHGPDQLIVAVEDCGIGIDPQHVGRLFNAFFTTKPDGMGLGLSICRSIIEAHGGRMSAANNAGPGATFQFNLPAYREAP